VISKIRLPIQALAVLLCATPAFAFAQENRGTSEQRVACAPDAFRLCVGYIPDPTRVEYCLRQNMSDLSDACRSVFEQSAGLLANKTQLNHDDQFDPRRPQRPIEPAIRR
jgi:hypothetical protein